jgi:hypothetical protein
MGKINYNRIRKSKAGESGPRRSFFGWLTQGNRKAAGAAILAVMVLHFASQFAFFESEEPLPTHEAVNIQIPENNPEIDLDLGTETQQFQIAAPTLTTPKTVTPTVRPEAKIAPSKMVIRKREPRESRTARLRRAERILTGV